MRKHDNKRMCGHPGNDGSGHAQVWAITAYPKHVAMILRYLQKYGCARTDIFHALMDMEIRHPSIPSEFRRRLRRGHAPNQQQLDPSP